MEEMIMRNKLFLSTLAGTLLAIALVMSGCSGETKGDSQADAITSEVVDQLVESITYAAESDSVDVQLASVEEIEPMPESNNRGEFNLEMKPITDMILVDDNIYAIVEDGIFMHNLTEGSSLIIPTEERITAMIDLSEKTLVGGENLYRLEEGYLVKEDAQLNLPGPITAFARQSQALLVGTTGGLYQIDHRGTRELAADIHVSALAEDPDGVWIGTAGNGLYRWDGQSFSKRYLQRDPTLFDNVTAMQFNHAHLYLGTDKGLFVYDGGRWEPHCLADGLPSETITAINADEWVVKIGTANGPVTFFNNEFKLMPEFNGTPVTRFVLNEKSMAAATVDGRILLKSGGLISTIYDGEIKSTEIALEDDI
jgi:hypothetical protein